jgi:hypothetical protein
MRYPRAFRRLIIKSIGPMKPVNDPDVAWVVEPFVGTTIMRRLRVPMKVPIAQTAHRGLAAFVHAAGGSLDTITNKPRILNLTEPRSDETEW